MKRMVVVAGSTLVLGAFALTLRAVGIPLDVILLVLVLAHWCDDTYAEFGAGNTTEEDGHGT